MVRIKETLTESEYNRLTGQKPKKKTVVANKNPQQVAVKDNKKPIKIPFTAQDEKVMAVIKQYSKLKKNIREHMDGYMASLEVFDEGKQLIKASPQTLLDMVLKNLEQLEKIRKDVETLLDRTSGKKPKNLTKAIKRVNTEYAYYTKGKKAKETQIAELAERNKRIKE